MGHHACIWWQGAREKTPVPRTFDLPVNTSYIQKEDVLPSEVTALSQACSHPCLGWLAELQNEIRVWGTFVVAPETPGLSCGVFYTLNFTGRRVVGKCLVKLKRINSYSTVHFFFTDLEMSSQVLRGVTTDWIRKVSPYKTTWTSLQS